MDVSRRYRWIRGDWQIAPWLGSHVPTADGKLVPNPLSALSRFKIFDNLRRSVVPIALLAFLLAGWLYAGAALVSTLVVFAILLLPAFLTRAAELTRRRQDLSIIHHGRIVLGGLIRQVLQEGFTLACLPYDAWISADAIFSHGQPSLIYTQESAGMANRPRCPAKREGWRCCVLHNDVASAGRGDCGLPCSRLALSRAG